VLIVAVKRWRCGHVGRRSERSRATFLLAESSAHQWVLLELKNIPLAAAEEVLKRENVSAYCANMVETKVPA